MELEGIVISHENRIQIIELKLSSLELQLKAVDESMDKISTLFFGNGMPGVKENIRTLMAEVSSLTDDFTAFVSETKEFRKSADNKELENRTWWKRLIVGAVVGTTISTGVPLLINLWILYTKLQP